MNQMLRLFMVMSLFVITAFAAGCGGGSGAATSSNTAQQTTASLTVKAVGPSIAGAGKMIGKTAESGIAFTSWDGSNASYGVPVYVEATYTDPTRTDLSGVDVVISTDHPELYDSVTVKTDASGLAKTVLYAKAVSDTQKTVNITAQTADGKILVTNPALITFMASQLKLTSPMLGSVVNIRDYPPLVDTTPTPDAIGIFLGGYETIHGANIRFPWFSVTKADGSPLADGLSYTISAMGLDAETLRANNEIYVLINPANWPDTYTQPVDFYNKTQSGRIPQFTQITTQVPAAGTSTTLEIIWQVTVTDPVAGTWVGYVAGTVVFQN